MTKTIFFIGFKFALCYCPKCKIVYFNKNECDCDNKYTAKQLSKDIKNDS